MSEKEEVSYEEFLRAKQAAKAPVGFPPMFLPDVLKGFQKYLCEWSLNLGRAAIYADCGLGKGHPDGTLLLTPTGWVPVEKVAVGDHLIGRNGTPCLVTGVFPKGEQDIYEVFFDDSTSLKVDSDHLWAVKSFNDKARKKDWRILSTSELLKSKLRYGKEGKSRTWHIPMVSPVEFPEKDFVIDPYVLGILLGDGCLSLSTQWTKPDRYIAEKVQARIPSNCTVNDLGNGDWSITTEPKRADNPITREIRRLGLNVRSWEKFVPDDYLFAAYDQRLDLLRGLMDTDGYSGESPEYSSSSRRLAEAVVFLTQSLGGTASLSVKEDTYYEYRGERKKGRLCYRVVLSMTGPCPFSLPRKADQWKSPSRGTGRWIDRIEQRGKQKSTCLSVDAADSLYVAENFIVTHNSVASLTFAQNVVEHTNKPTLILAPLAVSRQFVNEGKKFGIPCKQTQDGTVHKGINVTNYERISNYNPEDFAGVVGDESSILKNSDGKTRRLVTDFMEKIKYRLLGTATPAPNDYMELGTSSEALGVMPYRNMLAMFFVNDGKSTQQWRLKGHAKTRFWQWMATWARAVRKPSDLGFDDEGYDLPELEIEQHLLPSGKKGVGLLPYEAKTLSELREERHRTLHSRCRKVADLCPSDRPAIIWCHLNSESELLTKLIPGAVEVKGSDKDSVKEKNLIGFSEGRVRVLVTKPKIAGFGLNWQHCADVFYFPSFSHESYYQAIRRCWRFGQMHRVKCRLVGSEAERRVLNSMLRKERQSIELYSGVVRHMNDALKRKETSKARVKLELPSWL